MLPIAMKQKMLFSEWNSKRKEENSETTERTWKNTLKYSSSHWKKRGEEKTRYKKTEKNFRSAFYILYIRNAEMKEQSVTEK